MKFPLKKSIKHIQTMYNKYIKHGTENYLQKNSVLTINKSDS